MSVEQRTSVQQRQNEVVASLSQNQLFSLYEHYLSERGLGSSRIPEGTSKTPDFELRRGEELYLNEFKAPELHLNVKTGLFLFKTTNSKLLRFIHTANKQFLEYDPLHSKPWVVTFASTHFQLNWSNFTDALRGGMLHSDGSLLPPGFQKTDAFKSSLTDRYVPDLYLWLQVNPEEQTLYQATLLLNEKSSKKVAVEEIVKDLSGKPLSNMDNRFVLT